MIESGRCGKPKTYHREIERRWRKSVNKVPNGTSGRVLGKWDTENDAGNHQNIAIQNKISIFYRFLLFFRLEIAIFHREIPMKNQ